MDLSAAKALLDQCQRSEVPASGDESGERRASWRDRQQQRVLAEGVFDGPDEDYVELTYDDVRVSFSGDDARELRYCGEDS